MPLKVVKEESISTVESTVKSIVAIAAGKGGVGKSTLSVNLALALQEKGLRVGILDADIYGPSIGKMLTPERLPMRRGDRVVPALSRGIKLLSLAYFRESGESTAVRAPIANGIITQFLTAIDWGELDVLLIDFPPGTGDIQLTIAQKAKLSCAILITTPQEVALLDVRRARHLFSKVGVEILGVVENMSYFKTKSGEIYFPFGEGGGERLAGEIGAPLLAKVPLDEALAKASDLGLSIFEGDGAEEVKNAFRSVAKALSESLQGEREMLPVCTVKENFLEIAFEGEEPRQIPLALLQRNCPCAGCKGEGKSDPAVSAKELLPIGRYGLRILYSSGCSHGIWSFSGLKEMITRVLV